MLLYCSLLPLFAPPALSIFNEFLNANEPNTNVSSMDNSSFVYVDTVHPNITTNLRFATKENFMGRPLTVMLPNANRSLLTRQAAEALARAEELFERDGYRIVVRGAYRLQAVSNEFATWLRDPKAEQRRKAEHYPHVEKDNLAHLWYVGTRRSGHSRGSSVDVAIIPGNASLKPIESRERWLRDGRRVLYLDDGSEDMGTHIDLFDEASHHDSPLVNESQLAMRNYLKGVMQSVGFAPFVKEWWHYTLRNEPFPDTYFNFTVE